MFQGRNKCSLFFVDVPQQVLVDDELAMLKLPDTKEDDRAGKKTQRLDVEKDEVFRLVKTCSPQNERMGFRMPAGDQVHDVRRVSGRQAADDLPGFRPELRVTGKVGQCPEPPGVQPLPGHLPDAADKGDIPEQFFPDPVESNAGYARDWRLSSEKQVPPQFEISLPEKTLSNGTSW